jgi:hypothetical protein
MPDRLSQVRDNRPNYVQPLNVVWLCRPCHLAIHSNDGSMA